MNMQHERVNVTKMANGKNKFEIDVGDMPAAEAVAFIKELQASLKIEKVITDGEFIYV